MPEKRRKIFVLDSSILLHDCGALSNFGEHDVAVAISTIDDLERFSSGGLEINRQARDAMRAIQGLLGETPSQEPLSLGPGLGNFQVVTDTTWHQDRMDGLRPNTSGADILAAAANLAKSRVSQKVVLVSKSDGLRIKAVKVGLAAEDYRTAKIGDVQKLYKGKQEIEVGDPSLIDQLHQRGWIAPETVLATTPLAHQYFVLRSSASSGLATYNPKSDRIERITKGRAFGIEPKNAEQTFALHGLMNSDVSVMTITGPAGTGKTLLALAAGLEQRREFQQIYLARPAVPLSNRDLGFLPGDIKSKVDPYMQPLWDNLGVIRGQFKEKDHDLKTLNGLVESDKLHIVPLAYIRGRSFANVFFVVDEAQGLTPHEVKTIVTRAGAKTKIVLTGDIHQIDTPYLDAGSNGLSFLIDRFHGQGLYAHINLEEGERSTLATLASQLL